jgi:hypothetical protein
MVDILVQGLTLPYTTLLGLPYNTGGNVAPANDYFIACKYQSDLSQDSKLVSSHDTWCRDNCGSGSGLSQQVLSK